MVRPLRPPTGTSDTLPVNSTEELDKLMLGLGRRSKAVRSYVKHCLDDGMTTAQWQKTVKDAVSRTTWFKPYSQGGKYWGLTNDHDPLFRAAIEQYWSLVQKTRTVQHLRLTALAEKKMQEGVPMAAESMLKLAGKARNEQTKYNAAKFLISQRARSIDIEDATMWDEAEADAAQDDE